MIADRQHVGSRAVVVKVAEHRRRAAAQPAGEPAGADRTRGESDSDALELSHRQRSRAGPGDRVDDLAGADRVAQARGPLGERLARLGEKRQRGHALHHPQRVEVEAQQRVERRQVELVDAHGTRQRMDPQARDRLGRAERQTGLRPSQQLVAAEGHDVDPKAQRLAGRGLIGEQRQVGQSAAAEVVDDQGAALVSKPHELLDGRLAVKPTIR